MKSNGTMEYTLGTWSTQALCLPYQVLRDQLPVPWCLASLPLLTPPQGIAASAQRSNPIALAGHGGREAHSPWSPPALCGSHRASRRGLGSCKPSVSLKVQKEAVIPAGGWQHQVTGQASRA